MNNFWKSIETIKKYLKNNKKTASRAFSFILIILIIYIFEKNNLSIRIFEKKYAIEYIKKIFQNCLNNTNEYYSFNNNEPKISIIIPLYNCQNTINFSIASIQKQLFQNYEIILVNDYSTDNTSIVVNELMQKDYRINIINNKKNMGTLFSRSIGVLISKGKYILCLDNDDLFYDENLFGYLFNFSEIRKYDIVEFKSFYAKRYSFDLRIGEIKDSPFNNHPINYTLTQPDLGIFPISKNNKYSSNDFHLWGKSIKSSIYKKALNLLTEQKYSFYNCWTEDISILFIIFNLAQSFIFIGRYGIIHFDFKQTTTYTLHKSNKLMSDLFLLDIIIQYIQNIEVNKIYILQKLEGIFKGKFIKFLNIEHINYLKFIINSILRIRSLSNRDKDLLYMYMNKYNIK
jgi:glycosyltransferase involved in cell wall biosynthesis